MNPQHSIVICVMLSVLLEFQLINSVLGAPVDFTKASSTQIADLRRSADDSTQQHHQLNEIAKLSQAGPLKVKRQIFSSTAQADSGVDVSPGRAKVNLDDKGQDIIKDIVDKTSDALTRTGDAIQQVYQDGKEGVQQLAN